MASPSTKLTKTEINRLTKAFPNWKIDPDGKKAVLSVEFHRHVDALVFITRVSVHAEVLKHYPEIVFTEARVKLTTATGKTLGPLDVALMKRIDVIMAKRG